MAFAHIERLALMFVRTVIDLHCHALWGIDDGPQTLEGAVEMARASVAAGMKTVVATPHVSPRYPNDAPTIAHLIEQLRERLEEENAELEMLTGAEIALTRLADVEPEELASMGLGGGPWLLIECPFGPSVGGLEALLLALQRRGHGVVIAHPERCSTFQRDPQMLARLVESGALTSITAGSLVGDFGESVRLFSMQLAHSGLIHNVASDAHDTVNRAPGVLDQLEQAGLTPLAAWLTQAVPDAIIRGAEIPPRPDVVLAEPPVPSRPRRRSFRWSG